MAQLTMFGDVEYRDGVLYLVGERPNNGRYKIGITSAKQLKKRISDLSTGNPGLYLIDSWEIQFPPSDESFIHAWIQKFMVNGSNGSREWFYLEDAIEWMYRDMMKSPHIGRKDRWFSRFSEAVFGLHTPKGLRPMMWSYDQSGRPTVDLVADSTGILWSKDGDQWKASGILNPPNGEPRNFY